METSDCGESRTPNRWRVFSRIPSSRASQSFYGASAAAASRYPFVGLLLDGNVLLLACRLHLTAPTLRGYTQNVNELFSTFAVVGASATMAATFPKFHFGGVSRRVSRPESLRLNLGEKSLFLFLGHDSHGDCDLG